MNICTDNMHLCFRDSQINNDSQSHQYYKYFKVTFAHNYCNINCKCTSGACDCVQLVMLFNNICAHNLEVKVISF